MRLPNWCKINAGFCLCIAFPAPASSQVNPPVGAKASGQVSLICDPHAYNYSDPPPPFNPVSAAQGEVSISAPCPAPDKHSGSAYASSGGSIRGSLLATANADCFGPGPAPPEPPIGYYGAGSYAEFTNVLVFEPPSNDPSQKNTGKIGMRVDGRLNQDSQKSASAGACITFNSTDQICQVTPDGASGQLSFTLIKVLALQGVTGVTLTEGVSARADAYDTASGSDSSSADIGHTAQAFLQLPPGWTFTSGSGDFLLNQIRVLQSGRCLDADTGSIGSNGTKVQLWDCWGGKNQSWTVNSDGTIVNLQSGRCLDADTGSIGSSGTKVQLWDCWGGQNQKWVWPGFAPGTAPRGSDNHNVQSGRCLDADTGTIGSNGTNVQLWDCWGGQNQVWAH